MQAFQVEKKEKTEKTEPLAKIGITSRCRRQLVLIATATVHDLPFFAPLQSAILALCLLGLSAPGAVAADAPDTAPAPIAYPAAERGDVNDIYHGVRVPDPYRWLENLDAPETQAWIKAQNTITERHLAQCPARETIKQRLTELWDFEKFSIPFKKGGRYFYSKNDGLQNQAVLYTLATLDAEPKTLLDPNRLSDDGTIALSGIAISENGLRMAYALSEAGSDWMTWRVRDVTSGQDLPDVVRWSKFSGASWSHDHQGFYYSRYDKPESGSHLKEQNYYQKLCYHRLGTPQSEDVLIYERPDQKEWGFSGTVTEDGRYLIISVSKGTLEKNLVFFKDLQEENSPVVELISRWEAKYSFIGNDGSTFWFVTDWKAPRYRVVAIDSRDPDRWELRERIPESENTIHDVRVIGNRFVVNSMQDAHSQIKIFDLDGTPVRDVELPGLGTAAGFHGRREDLETFYSYTSFTHPTTIYRYAMESGESHLFRQPEIDIDPDAYVVKQVFYQSKDGTRIPMFITHRKQLDRDGTHPTYLYGYGGFNISLTPFFSVSNIAWMEMGGILAVPNLRGGGEYGEAWHQAGMKQRKQNVFDDFIAAAEWLIANGYTSREKLAIGGGSNGGLLVGACMVQRPDLFAAAIPAVGVMDMIRFPQFTIGWAWTSDYGSPDNPDEFKALWAYSPYHNLRPNTEYPATLITTADHDDRVYPAHSFKFAAALQAAHCGKNPVLIRIETRAGHGAGKPTTKQIEEAADKWTFLVETLDMNSVFCHGSCHEASPFSGHTPHPDESWMKQIVRNWTVEFESQWYSDNL